MKWIVCYEEKHFLGPIYRAVIDRFEKLGIAYSIAQVVDDFYPVCVVTEGGRFSARDLLDMLKNPDNDVAAA